MTPSTQPCRVLKLQHFLVPTPTETVCMLTHKHNKHKKVYVECTVYMAVLFLRERVRNVNAKAMISPKYIVGEA